MSTHPTRTTLGNLAPFTEIRPRITRETLRWALRELVELIEATEHAPFRSNSTAPNALEAAKATLRQYEEEPYPSPRDKVIAAAVAHVTDANTSADLTFARLAREVAHLPGEASA